MKYLTFLILTLFFTACGDNSDEGAVYSNSINSNLAPQVTQTQQELLVVRVEYDNQLFVNDADVWAKKIFGSEKHQLNHYYKEVSQNKFSFIPAKESDRSFSSRVNDGVVTVHLYKNHPNSGSSSSIHSDLKEALEKASQFVNFKTYDEDNSKTISVDELNIIFIIAGAEDSYAVVDRLNSVWAHQSCISNSIVVDDVSVADCSSSGSYALFGERHIDYIIPAHDATIGIIAHELGHELFTLPDLYPTSSSTSSSGIGYFGLMGGGLWAYSSFDEGNTLPGNTPSHFCAWSKIHNKWIEPVVVNRSATISLPSTSQSSYKIAKIVLDSDEYLLLENRATNGYDSGLYAIDGNYVGGIALWHINDNVIKNNLKNNEVQNSEKNKGVDLVEARFANIDNSQTSRGHAKNLFYKENTSSAKLTTNLFLEEISSPSSIMSLKVVK